MPARKILAIYLLCLSPLFFSLQFLTAANEAQPASVRIGMVQTLFTDIPVPLVQVIIHPFGALMKEFTGLDGKMVLGGEPLNLAREINDGKVDLGVFNGVEFAWAQKKYPNLRPLMVAVTKYKHAQAHVVVRTEEKAGSFADLKGQAVAYPLRSGEHCRLFFQRACTEFGQAGPQEFFRQVVASPNVERALDDLCLGKVQAAVVDTVGLDAYQNIKPGCRARLKVLKDSEVFPTGVIAYREGAIEATVLTRFRKGLAGANQTERGRDMMSMFRITSFESIPEDYHQNLADIIKAYPPPETIFPVSLPR